MKNVKKVENEQGVRPGVLLGVAGAAAITTLLWAIAPGSSPSSSPPVASDAPATQEPVKEVTAMTHPASHGPFAALKPRSKDNSPMVRAQLERESFTHNPWMMSTDTSLTAPPPKVPGYSGPLFDYAAEANQLAEGVRSVIAKDEAVAAAMPGDMVRQIPGISVAGTAGHGNGVGQANVAPGPSGPHAYVGPNVKVALSEPPPVESGVSPEVTGQPGPGDSGVTTGDSGAAVQAPGIASTTGANANGVVNDGYRSADRIRRAYVEEMRIKRIQLILAARQQEGN